MKEQLLSRNVEPAGNGYRISAQGRALMRFSRFVAGIFHTDPRFVHPGAADKPVDR
jgi:hypothetical protein